MNKYAWINTKDLPGAKAGTVGRGSEHLRARFYQFGGFEWGEEDMELHSDFFKRLDAPTPPKGWRLTGELRVPVMDDMFIEEIAPNYAPCVLTMNGWVAVDINFGLRWIVERVEEKPDKSCVECAKHLTCVTCGECLNYSQWTPHKPAPEFTECKIANRSGRLMYKDEHDIWWDATTAMLSNDFAGFWHPCCGCWSTELWKTVLDGEMVHATKVRFRK